MRRTPLRGCFISGHLQKKDIPSVACGQSVCASPRLIADRHWNLAFFGPWILKKKKPWSSILLKSKTPSEFDRFLKGNHLLFSDLESWEVFKEFFCREPGVLGTVPKTQKACWRISQKYYLEPKWLRWYNTVQVTPMIFPNHLKAPKIKRHALARSITLSQNGYGIAIPYM